MSLSASTAAQPSTPPGTLTFDVEGVSTTVAAEAVVIAGFTGKDQDAVRAHLAELAELGVPTPVSTPCYYQAPPSALCQTPLITVVEPNTSGEAECVLIADGDARWITLGSDHTDRAAESIDIPLSKVVTQKPLATAAWPLADVAGHLGRIELRSWISDGAGQPETLYQDGTLGEFLPVDELLAGAPFARQPVRVALFGGTLAAIGGIRPAAHFRAELFDPVRDRKIELAYTTVVANYLA